MLASAAKAAHEAVHVPGWAWPALLAFLTLLLAVDLVRHKGHTEPTTKQALRETLGWVAVGIGFSVVVLFTLGGQAFSEFSSGYVIEKSLSVDNVFVWAVIFDRFGTPLKYQHRVLFWGIFGALVMRFAFIFAGSAVLESLGVVAMVPFGAFLVYTGLKVLKHEEDEGEKSHDGVLKALSKVMPVTEDLDGHRFFTKKNGVRMATGLFACLVVVEVTDVIFAVDSVPAVLAVSSTPFIVFASNAFAILGLRAMYFLLASAKDSLHYLSHALGSILVFVGMKMAVSHWYHIPTVFALGAIVVTLTVAIWASVLRNRKALALA